MTDGATDGETRRAERLNKRNNLHREERHAHLVRAGLVGAIAGALGVAYEYSVNQAEAFSAIVSAWAHAGGPIQCILMVLGATAIGGLGAHLIGVYAPESGGSGIPHVKAALLHLRIIRPIRLIIAKFFGGLAALMVGMSFGREGPTVQMGASIGKLVGDLMKVSRRGRTSLIAAGAGAGLAAAFNAPLAGFLFVMEELRREMSALTYGSALVASVCSVAVTRYLSGLDPQFILRSPKTTPLQVLPEVALLGIVCGFAGVLFNKAIFAALDIRSHFNIPRWIYGAVVGAVSGVALLYFDTITQSGHKIAENLLLGTFQSQHLALALVVIFVAKLFLTSASYGTGMPGGIFAPLLVLGSLVGFLFGICVHQIAPGVPFSNGGFATLGMAAMLSGSVRAPLTGAVLIVEMTGEYRILYALLIVSFTASLTAELLKAHPIYDALMERDLHLEGAEIQPSAEPLLLEVLVEPHSRMDGIRVKNLKLPPGAILTMVERDGGKTVPGGGTLLSSGDMVTILVDGDKPELGLDIHERAKAPS